MLQSDPSQVNIQIGGNVEGNIVVGDNNFVVNNNHGTIVYKQAAPQVGARNFVPQPPRATRGFINRGVELQKLESWISANEMILIHAPDGMGKSALLKQVANSPVGRAMPGGVILLEGVGGNEDVLGANDIIQRLFDILFESDPPLKVTVDTARPYLSNTRPLLLLDEVPISPALQNALPDLFPNGAMLFTSDVIVGREDFLRLPIGPLQRDVAVRLLVNKSGLELTEQNRATFDSLCALLGDVSLAVVITGNVIRETGVTLEDTLNQIQQISNVHQAALDRAYHFAFNRLTPEEQSVISTAALTPGVSMSPEWLVAAFGSQEAERFVERLRALGLLVANSPRLRVPPGIRIPAQRAAVVDENTVLRRLADFLLSEAQINSQNWEFFADELGNLFGALTWAIRTNDLRLALRLGRALDPFLTLRGLWDTWRDLLDILLDAARRSGNRAAEAFALHQIGTREIGLGAPQRALDYLRQALRIRQALGDTVGMAYTQHNIDLLIGPPSPPNNNQPEPGPPSPVTAGGTILLVVSTLGFLSVLGLALIWLFFGNPSQPQPPITPSVTTPTNTPIIWPTDTPTGTPTATQTITPTPTSSPTPTPTSTPVLPFLAISLTNSALQDTAFLYQGSDSDYFEVPVRLRLTNTGAANITSFNISLLYEAYDGSHPARFRFDGQSTYFDYQPVNDLATNQLREQEIRVRVPRAYQNTDIRLSAQTDRCQSDIRCTINDFSYSLPQIVYDFIDNAQSAAWRGYDPSLGQTYDLKFNGDVVSTGSVRLDRNLTLEDGFQPDYALFTHPTWANKGEVTGSFSLSGVTLAKGDRLFVRVGFLDGAGGDGVTFHFSCDTIVFMKPFHLISYNKQGSYYGDLLTIKDQYDRILRGANIILPDDLTAAGCPIYGMRVEAGPSPDSDWAVWLSAYIARFRPGGVPPPPPTSTSAPPRAAPTITSFPTTGPIF